MTIPFGCTGAATPPIPPSTLVEYYVDADEAARFLKLDRRTVLRWAREGKLPAHPLDPSAAHKDWRFLLSELDSWLRGQVHSACRSCRSHGGRIQ
jgi:excisionase family DNA binding protein